MDSCKQSTPISEFDNKYSICSCGNHIFSNYNNEVLKPYYKNKYKLYKNNKRHLYEISDVYEMVSKPSSNVVPKAKNYNYVIFAIILSGLYYIGLFYFIKELNA